MTASTETIEATTQLDRARETLGQALGQTQDINNSGIDVEKVTESLAGAVRGIFSVQNAGMEAPSSLENIQGTMDHLRETLERLQEVESDDPSLHEVTGTVARILAIIYPVSKEMEKTASLSETVTPDKPPAEDEPIPLTQVKTSGESAPRESLPPLKRDSLPRLSAPPAGGERRTCDRRIVQADIGIQSDSNFFTGFTEDISSGGLFIATYNTLKIGTKLNINFSLPGGPVLSLDGTIRWLREYNETNPDTPPGMGVQFDDVDKADREAINKFMADNPPFFYDDE
jgi:uncharacterized protein (TIGR02266 family)